MKLDDFLIQLVKYCTSEYICTGFLVVADVPSPKLQLHVAGEPVLVSVNAIVKGLFPEVTLLLKLATGSIGPGEPEVTRGSKSE